MTNLDYLYNSTTPNAYFNKNYFIDKKLGFRVIENGMIIPHKQNISGNEFWGGGGIVDGKGEFVKSSFVRDDLGKQYTPP